MRIRADVEDIQTTRTEKLLAVVLTAFLLLGGIWTYQKLDDVVRAHVAVPSYETPGPASAQLQRAEERLQDAQLRRQRALQNLELRREAYRTALEAKKPAAQLEARYNTAQAELNSADHDVRSATQDVRAV